MDLSYITEYTFLIPLLPALGFVFVIALGKRMEDRLVGLIASGTVLSSFLLSVVAFLHIRTISPDEHSFQGWEQNPWTWIEAGVLKVPFGFLVDPLSVVMLLFVTGIGFLIHVYSTGYMKGDPGFSRFFAYLNLFMASMLMLVMGSSVLTMFIGWEGVGLSSYLLIGFWWREAENHNPQPATANVAAATKAFVVNRVGDFAFILGIAVLMWATWNFTGGHGDQWTSLTFTDMRAHMETFRELEAAKTLSVPMFGAVGAVTFACILFFIGATGKSAQIPLYVWLPDAMAGPTPVSALIHAATMVTAGIYMICRLNFLYQLSPVALAVVATVGALTAVFAATIGLFQHDIKAVLAYSTVSQLGYMFLGVGTGVFAVGMFHVFTHAFFKALLFLGAGSIIHAMHHVLPHGENPQDMRVMGGLRKFMPTTYRTFWVAWIAIIGIFPFAGFWSKDEILWKSFERFYNHEQYGTLYLGLYILGLIGALLTAFYMSRLVFGIFRGEYKGRKITEDHNKTYGHHEHVHDPHESPWTMTLPLVILAVGAAAAGLLGLPHWLGTFVDHHYIDLWGNFLEPSFAVVGGHGVGHAAADAHGAAAAGGHGAPWQLEAGLAVMSVLLAGASAWYAGTWFLRRPERLSAFYERWRQRRLYLAVLNKYYVDEFYQATIINLVLRLKEWVATAIDGKPSIEKFIDFLVNGTATVMKIFYSIVSFFDTYVIDGEDAGQRKGFIHWLTIGVEQSVVRVRALQSGDVQTYLRVVAAAAGIGVLIWIGLIGIK